MKYLRIKNWESFQHYKDRSPTWIKLHKSLLDNFEYQCLPLASKALAPMLWLLASEYSDPAQGLIEHNYRKIAFRLRVTEDDVAQAVKPLIENGFLELYQDASEPLAEAEQVAIPETYREEDIEKRKRERRSADPFSLPDWIPEQPWNDFVSHRKASKKSFTDQAKKLIVRELEKLRQSGNDPKSVLEQSIRKGWLDVFKLAVDFAPTGQKKLTEREYAMNAIPGGGRA